MDLDSTSFPITSKRSQSSESSHLEDFQGSEDEDPYSLHRTSNLIIGLAIAIASIGVPISVVLNERSFIHEKFTPNTLEPYGSKSSPPISFNRLGKPRC